MSQESGPQETGFSLEARKTLKDRLNYPWLMEQAIMSFRKVQTDLDKSDADMVEAVQAVINMIPSKWWDDQFKKAYDAALIVKVTDCRPSFCGQVASIEWCQEHGVRPFLEENTFDVYKLFHAAVDLLDRLGLLSRKWFTEKMTGRRYTGAAADIADVDVETIGE